jgi:SsrA-binding protein
MGVHFINKRAEFDYEILERFEAGILLSGHEVRSIRAGHANLLGARAIIRGNELYVVGMQIPSFQPENEPGGYDAERTRKLLLNKEEILRLLGKTQSGLTLVVTKLYSKNRFLKLELGLARIKKKYDKRETIKKRETEREIRRIVS